MTLDELIERAVELKEKFGGDTKVACWPYDGQSLRASYAEGVEIAEYDDSYVVVDVAVEGGREAHTTSKAKFLMVQHKD